MTRLTKYGLSLAMVFVAAYLFPVPSDAQQSARVYQIGVIQYGSPDAVTLPLMEAFRQGLRDLGYSDGQNVNIQLRWQPPERPDLLPDIANELVRSKVDVLVGGTTPIIMALKQATKTIPIVMIAPSDPVGTGLIDSLARPGGNVTGLTWMARDMQGLRLQLLKEIVPKMSRVADLWNPANPATQRDFRELEVAARTLGIALYSAEARAPNDLVGAFTSITHANADAVVVQADPLTIVNREQIADLAAQWRLPSMFYMREFVEDGGLISYGASLRDQYRRTAAYVDKIFRGVRTVDLPVEQPTEFELVVNLRTAKRLGLNIPEAILLRADAVIR